MPVNTPTLEVDLSALTHNYLLLRGMHAKDHIGAVVKANAYGLGMDYVARALWKAGCREFFVATLAEGIELRQALPDGGIAVLNGLMIGEEREFLHHRLTPVLNDPGQVARFAGKGAAILHIDTGMTRLGLSASELDRMVSGSSDYQKNFTMVMSHLACANEAAHPKNGEQLKRFKTALQFFPGLPASFANSSGLFLPADFHFDTGRPGCALYGINPVMGENPMRHVATLSAPILQVRTLDRNETVGYGASFEAKKGARIAIVGLGYADGYFRLLSNKGAAYINGVRTPIAGRVSMDMIALDVSTLPDLSPTARAEFINAAQTVSDVAQQAGTIGYEVFTRIGRRVARIYK